MNAKTLIRSALAVAAALFATAVLRGGDACAAQGDCGIPFTTGTEPKTSDCLYILRTGVGLLECRACTCDTSGNGTTSATDALLCLRRAVGQNVSFDCPPCDSTTTLPPDTTTTTIATTTTTTLPDPGGSCPGSVEWRTDAGYGEPCDGDGDCASGNCDAITSRCRTVSELDLGWTGLAHDLDLNDEARRRALVDCPDGASGGACGTCEVTGIDPSDGSCRCSNNPRVACDEPQQLDGDDCPACLGGAFAGSVCSDNADCDLGTCSRRCDNDRSIVCTKKADCGAGNCLQATSCSNGLACSFDNQCSGTCTTGSLCQCFDGAPLPINAGGTPLCIVNRYSSDISGTVNVDTGASAVQREVRTVVYNGVSVASPCPFCGGTCSNSPSTKCAFDADCGPGAACNDDPVPGDGVRGGVCVGGFNDGDTCDVHAANPSFPAEPGRRGAGVSLDCMPTPGSSISGSGLKLSFTESTASVQESAQLPCDPALPDADCHCRVCSGDATVACGSDADCAAAGGTCSGIGGLAGAQPRPNACTDGQCQVSGNEGSCANGPDDLFCDGVVQSDDRGVFACVSNADCDAANIGVDAGACALETRRDCFAGTIVAAAAPHPTRPVTSALVCVPPLTTAGRNAQVGLPGPARLRRQNELRSYCAADPSQRYTPGVGGCAP